MSVEPNSLLLVMSARGSMTWAQYCEAVDFLSASVSESGRSTDWTATRSGLLQILESMGHCDTYYDQGASIINVSPPALCRLPKAGLPIAVLTGARSPKTQEQIAEAAQARRGAVQINVERQPGPLGLLPDTILVRSASEAEMARFCSDLHLRYAVVPPAWTLANWCGTLSEYETTLDFRIPDTLNWVRYDFDINFHGFVRMTSDTFPRYSRYRNPATGLPLHVFFRDRLGAETDLKWGRYLFLKSNGITVTAYDEKRFRLCVPVMAPLPAVIARSICLCSGKPPVHRAKESFVKALESQGWLMFEDVPPQIALAALSKVGQVPERININ